MLILLLCGLKVLSATGGRGGLSDRSKGVDEHRKNRVRYLHGIPSMIKI